MNTVERMNPERVLFQVTVEQVQALYLARKGNPIPEKLLEGFEEGFLASFRETDLTELLADGLEDTEEELTDPWDEDEDEEEGPVVT